MKTPILAIFASLASILAASAAPRLVVSTPSLMPESKIDLVFDTPVVAVGDLGKSVDNKWLEIQPALAGKLLWKAQSIAQLVPDHAPLIGATYTFSIPNGLKSIDGNAIPAGKITSIASEPFRIEAANALDRWSSDYSASTAEWLIVFNDDVDPATAAAFVSFNSRSGQRVAAHLERATVARAGYYAKKYRSWTERSSTTPAAEATQESPLMNVIVATPESPLPIGKEWNISALKGLPNTAANARLIEDSTYAIGDVNPFVATSIDSYIAANEPRKIIFTFNEKVGGKLPDQFLADSIVCNPRPENLSAKIDDKQIELLGDFSIADKYEVTIKPPLLASSGLELSNPMKTVVTFEHIEPSLALPSENQAQLATGSRTYRIQTVNLTSIHVRVKQLAGSNFIRPYQGFSNYSGVGHNGKPIEPTAPLPYSLIAGKTIFERDIPLGNPIDTSKEITLNWNEILLKGAQNASLFLDVTGTPQVGTKEGRRSAQAMIQLTDIGLAWKIIKDKAFIYAFSCDTGAPLADVKIDLIGSDANVLGTSNTDAAGCVTVDRSEAVHHIHATQGHDSYLTAFDSTLSTVGLWHFPIRYSWNKSTAPVRKAFLFTDRSLYRPGETVRLKGIVRSKNGNSIEAVVHAPARIVIIDPAEMEIHTSPVTISANGSFDLTYKLPVAKTGSYTIRLEFPEELAAAEKFEDDWERQEAMIASARFELPLRVEEFRRNAFEITQTIATPAIGATSLTANIAATYYQGQPVATGKVKYFSRVTAQNPYPERFRDFLFGNHRTDDWTYWYHYFGYRSDDGNESGPASQIQSETVLSPDGKATLSVAIPQADFPTFREVTISSEVTDANNQTLTSVSNTTVHPASVDIGVSRIDQLVHAGDNLPLKIVATDIAGEPYKGAIKVTATLTREVNSTVKSRTDSGATTTRNDVTEETISTSEITLDPAANLKEGTPFVITPKSTGRHFLTIRGTDPEGHAFATVSYFNVYGTDEYPWLYEDGMRVKLVAEKKSYKPGETAKILVLSPIEGTALVTVEREKVLRSFLVPLTAQKPIIEVPLSEDDAPNAYISVLIVKGAKESARAHKEPQLRLGYCELTIENLRDTLAVSLTPNSTTSYHPGDEITLTGSVTLANGSPAANAEVTVYAEDEGTLAVMGYETPRPMDYFYSPRLLAVDTGTSFETFISEDPDSQDFSNKGFFIGGGGDYSKLAEQLRKNFDPCATWAPTIITGVDGKFTHHFKVPDTLTRYRVIAIAHQNTTRFGHVESSILVNKDLMLEPKTPRFANQGDHFDSRVLVQNASTSSGTWEITFSTENGNHTPSVKPDGPVSQTITLDAGKSTTLDFACFAESTGEAALTFKATPVSLTGTALTPELTHRLSDAVESRFQVIYPMPLIRQSKLIKLEAGKKAINLRDAIDPILRDGSGHVDLEFSRSPLVEAGSSIDFLISYPHGCVEQTSSALIPWLCADSLSPVIPSFAKLSKEKIATTIQAGADRLLTMQLPDGSFTYWPGGTQPVPWATSYAGLVLIMTTEHGAIVPDNAITSLKKNLIESLHGLSTEKSSFNIEIAARSLLVLSIAGEPQEAYQNLMLARIAELSPTARALLATAICASDKDNPTAQSSARSLLNSKVPFKTTPDDWMPWRADDAYQVIAWLAAEPSGEHATKSLEKMLRDRSPYGHWRTTWVNGWSVLAMAAYAENQKIGDKTIAIHLKTNSGTETLSLSSEHPTVTRSFPLSSDIKLDLSSETNAFVRLNVSAKPKIAPIQPVATNGLSIDRIYKKINSDGRSEFLKEPKIGDLIRVTLRVTLPKDDSRYLAIVDPLPAIFETVNSDFKSQSAAVGIHTSENDWQVSHSELRTDRAEFFLDHVWKKGTYTVTYLARCTIAGTATAPLPQKWNRCMIQKTTLSPHPAS